MTQDISQTEEIQESIGPGRENEECRGVQTVRPQ